MVGFDESPTFVVKAPGQRTVEQRIIWEIRHGVGPLRRAIEAEGLWGEWKDDKAKL